MIGAFSGTLRQTLIFASREMGSMFRIPVGWVVIALFVFLTGVLFTQFALVPGQAASMRIFFSFCAPMLIVVAPAVSMRLVSDELRSGTIESLMTMPASDISVVLGKYLGAVAFLGAMLLPTLVFVCVLYAYSDPAPEPGPIVAGYLSLLLVGGFYLSIGLLASCLTSSQTLAFLGTFLALLVLLLGPGLLGDALPPGVAPWVRDTLYRLRIPQRIDDFAGGAIQLRHVVFFLSMSAGFVALAWAAYTSRRWR